MCILVIDFRNTSFMYYMATLEYLYLYLNILETQIFQIFIGYKTYRL